MLFEKSSEALWAMATLCTAPLNSRSLKGILLHRDYKLPNDWLLREWSFSRRN